MSKNKNKKSKQSTAKLSPEGYIRKKAQALPIYECIINNEWKESGMAQIIIARNHVNGNLTLGLFLVDIYCLGVKDTFFQFNISATEYDDLKSKYFSDFEIEKCDYTLVHNIIYGAISFAEDFGFHPHKDFKRTTQYILEKDNDDVELIDIEFGLNGKPCAVSSPYGDIQSIVAQLEKTAGKGNYEIIQLDENGDMVSQYDEDEDWDENFEEFGFLEPEAQKSFKELKEMEGWSEQEWKDGFTGKKQISRHTLLLFIDMYFYGLSDKVIFGELETEIKKLFDFEWDDAPIHSIEAYKKYYPDPAFIQSTEMITEVFDKGNTERAIKLTRNMIETHQSNPVLLMNLIAFYHSLGKTRKAHNMTLYAWEKFPDFLFIKIDYAYYLMSRGMDSKIHEIFDNKFSLPELFPDRDTFLLIEVRAFYDFLFYFFINQGKIGQADMILKILKELDGRIDTFETMEERIAEEKIEFIRKNLENYTEKNEQIKSNMKVVR